MMERNGEGWKDRKKMIDVNINNIIYMKDIWKSMIMCVCVFRRERM